MECKLLTTLLLAIGAAILATDPPQAATNRPLVGVIRWDGYTGSPNATQQQEMRFSLVSKLGLLERTLRGEAVLRGEGRELARCGPPPAAHGTGPAEGALQKPHFRNEGKDDEVRALIACLRTTAQVPLPKQ